MTVSTMKMLCGRYVTLRPFDGPSDHEYLLKLYQQYPWQSVTVEKAIEELARDGKYFWRIYHLGESSGVVYLSYHAVRDMWTLSGLEDRNAHRRLKDRLLKTVEVADLVCGFAKEITDLLYTFQDKRNRKAHKLVELSGFKFCEDFIVPWGIMKLYIKRLK